VAETAKQKGTTRALAAVDKAAELRKPLIFAIGNAPTALLRICELKEAGVLTPELVIGVPVGFVNVVESKEALIASGIPFITARGRKGGSNIAAAIVNALLRLA
jgi:precorrin-8X/cobalt-precorrin-8 methylmutase